MHEVAAVPAWVPLAYLIAGVCFILALRGLSSPVSSRRGNRFGDEAAVTIDVAGNEVVTRFPLTHLASAERFRWSLAPEWGRYEVIGTTGAARDDGPDGDAPVRFPAG